MAEHLRFKPLAARALLRLPDSVRDRLLDRLDLYGRTGEGDVKRLVGSDARRLRDGEYRAIFTETDDEITVVRLGRGRDVYR